ncbi:MAG: ribosomal protein L13e [Ignisphaera sp.]|uniref:Large ribosomal subunit protein eL13 n=1 Tax=Ignisphaera aggregans TaxID=334771 RepID=A0A7C4JKB1_9CREN
MENEDIIIIEIPPPMIKPPKITKGRGVAASPRVGRGFSTGEIKQAGLTVQLARQFNIPLDFRRRSIHQHNVENLRKFAEKVSMLINVKKTKPAKIVQQKQEPQQKST